MKADLKILDLTIKNQNENDFKKFLTALIHEASGLIGQQKIEQHIEVIAFQQLGIHVKKYYSNYSVGDLRKALHYGYKNDQTQGGSIYAQRLIFWIDKYHKEVWLPKNKKDIHNQSNLENKMIAPKEITPQEFIISQFELYRAGKIGFLGTKVFEALDQLGLKNKIWNAEKSWEFIFKACESLKTKASSGNAFADYRNINEQCKRIVKGNIETVSMQILAETKRKMVKDLFKKFDSKDDVEMWFEMMID